MFIILSEQTIGNADLEMLEQVKGSRYVSKWCSYMPVH